LTRNEIRRLLTAAIAPVHLIEHVIHWSTWRRQHQARAPHQPPHPTSRWGRMITKGRCRTRKPSQPSF